MSRTLLLQGPVGPFFNGLAQELRRRGDQVTQIVFNGGDEWFADREATIRFTGSEAEWPTFLDGILTQRRIDRVFLFGDCRALHRSALELCRAKDITTFVVEEGYLRPSFVTIEEFGVNAFSRLPRRPTWYLEQEKTLDTSSRPLMHYRWAFLLRTWICIQYYMAMALGRRLFPAYVHHRCSDLRLEGAAWVRSLWRWYAYRFKERNELARLHGKKFYLVPLQVHNDSQVSEHSDFTSVADFIHVVMASFAKQAPENSLLVIKHHPMDRGYVDYAKILERVAIELGIYGRVRYVHDVPLPNLLRAASGVVVINSTVGLSSLIHGVPVKALGRAIYDLPGLTSAQSLDAFWRAPRPVDRHLANAFCAVLKHRTQLNASTSSQLSTWDLFDRVPEFVGRPQTEAILVPSALKVSN